jgi:hypothetical protein
MLSAQEGVNNVRLLKVILLYDLNFQKYVPATFTVVVDEFLYGVLYNQEISSKPIETVMFAFVLSLKTYLYAWSGLEIRFKKDKFALFFNVQHTNWRKRIP